MSTQTSANEEAAGGAQQTNEELTSQLLSTNQRDALGEVGNICMGTCATTLSTLLGKRVVITTPKVSITKRDSFFDEYEKPIMAAEISYTQGVQGNNVLLLKKEDAILISNLLMGNDAASADEDNTELFTSVISEVMNQMVGSSSTAMSDILEAPVNIAPPVIKELSPDEDHFDLKQDDTAIMISFKMEIEDLLDSNIMQIMSIDFGKRLADSLMNVGGDDIAKPQQRQDVAAEAMRAAAEQEQPQPAPPPQPEKTAAPPPAPAAEQAEKVEIKAAKYESFESVEPMHTPQHDITTNNNMDLIVDVPLQVTVVLGKSKKSIKDILGLNIGSVIVLDRLAGEKVDVLVNGRLFAHGEVVVIDDNYGVRITDIISPDDN